MLIALLAPSLRPELMAAPQDRFTLSGRITTDYGCAIPEVTVVVSSDAAGIGGPRQDDHGQGRALFIRSAAGPQGTHQGRRRIAWLRVCRTHDVSCAEPPEYLGRRARIGASIRHRPSVGRHRRRFTKATGDGCDRPLLRPHMDGRLTQLRTDAAGRFLFDNVDEGAHVVIVTRPAYEAASRLVESTPSTSNVASTFTLTPCKKCPRGTAPVTTSALTSTTQPDG